MSACLSHCLCVWLSECLSVCIFVRVCVYVRSNKYGLVKSYKMLVAQLPCGKRIQHKMSPISATTLPGNRRRHYHPNMTFLGVSFPSVSPSVRICSVCGWVCLSFSSADGSGSFLLAAVRTQDVGFLVREETSADESSLAFRTLEAIRMPLSTVECYELRIINTYRITKTDTTTFTVYLMRLFSVRYKHVTEHHR